MRTVVLLALIILFIPACSYQPSNEDVVDTHGEITNLEKFMKFVENVNQGEEDNIRIVRYTTEGDPILHDLEYDGEMITSTTDTTRDEFGVGSVNTKICKTIDVKETAENTDYTLSGCDLISDNSILVIWN
ncbi:DUF4362 domain-containing protein [Bacillus sp. J37]|uniref:DUF4362 domain-containing protein n=1 Tax=Bacillus sp. J37 TaxID=935837 RepID=UPI0004AFC431|nr:DUF4362 domain-containing protein [Bacillus sp. J37]